MTSSLTCHIVSYSNCCQSDDDKICWLQSRPALNVFEDHSWDGDKQDAASQDEEESGGHTDFSLAYLVVFILWEKVTPTERISNESHNTCSVFSRVLIVFGLVHYHISMVTDGDENTLFTVYGREEDEVTWKCTTSTGTVTLAVCFLVFLPFPFF